MLNLAQRIDHGNAGELRDALDRLVSKRPQHNPADPALKIVCDVAERFTCIEPLMSLINKAHRSAKSADSRLKGKPSAQRRLLEKHGNVLARQHRSELLRPCLHAAG